VSLPLPQENPSPARTNLFRRVLSALVLVPLVLGVLQYGSPGLVWALVLVIGVLSWHEYAGLVENMGVPVCRVTGLVLTVLILSAFLVQGYLVQEPYPEGWVALPALSLIVLFLAWLTGGGDRRLGLDSLAYSLLGVIYVPGLLGFLLLLHDPVYQNRWVFFVLLVVWVGDVAAFFVGRALGRRRLAPRISPGKTVEGAVANVLGGLAGGALAKLTFLPSLSWGHCLLGALICGMIGQLGDLFESLLKRNAGVKDSGRSIPGHGGLLDRIDSLLFAGPAFYCYWRLMM